MKQLILALSVLGLSACGSNPNDPSNFAQLAGTWTGTLQSANWADSAVRMQLSQSNDAITGTWLSEAHNWEGTISGSVSKTNFTGTFTLTGPNTNGGNRCTGTASVSGPAGNGNTINWSSPGFTGTCTGEPIDLRWSLQR